MRNLLALLATAVIVFAAVGWYLGSSSASVGKHDAEQ